MQFLAGVHVIDWLHYHNVRVSSNHWTQTLHMLGSDENADIQMSAFNEKFVQLLIPLHRDAVTNNIIYGGGRRVSFEGSLP